MSEEQVTPSTASSPSTPPTPRKGPSPKVAKIFALVSVIIMLGSFATVGIIKCNEPTPEERFEEWSRDFDAQMKHEKDSTEKYRATLSPEEQRQWKIKDSIAYEELKARNEEQNKSEHPEEYLNFEDFTWRKGGFGSVGIVDVTFVNKGNKTASNIVINVAFLGESGSVLNTYQEVVTTVVQPGQKKHVKDINMGFINSQVSNAMMDIIRADWN
jgi:hypothetical protein